MIAATACAIAASTALADPTGGVPNDSYPITAYPITAYPITALPPATDAALTAAVTNSANVATSGTWGCWPAYGASTPYFLYRLGDTTDRAEDTSGNGFTGWTKSWVSPGPAQPVRLVTGAAPKACTRDEVASAVFAGRHVLYSGAPQWNTPTRYSIELWFRTTVAGGTLAIFGEPKNSYTYPESDPVQGLSDFDRALYVAAGGRLNFAVYESGSGDTVTFRYLKSPSGYLDGLWHHVVVTVDSPPSSAGTMIMYVDGVQVAGNSTPSIGANGVNGYWRFGAGPLWCMQDAVIKTGGVKCADEIPYYTGDMSFVAVYKDRLLSASEFAAHYAAR